MDSPKVQYTVGVGGGELSLPCMMCVNLIFKFNDFKFNGDDQLGTEGLRCGIGIATCLWEVGCVRDMDTLHAAILLRYI